MAAITSLIAIKERQTDNKETTKKIIEDPMETMMTMTKRTKDNYNEKVNDNYL